MFILPDFYFDNFMCFRDHSIAAGRKVSKLIPKLANVIIEGTCCDAVLPAPFPITEAALTRLLDLVEPFKFNVITINGLRTLKTQ